MSRKVYSNLEYTYFTKAFLIILDLLLVLMSICCRCNYYFLFMVYLNDSVSSLDYAASDRMINE
jgi:hypothetical protein